MPNKPLSGPQHVGSVQREPLVALVLIRGVRLTVHDLRHSGAVLAAQSGATLAELMGRLGYSTPRAALRYQHAADGRDRVIAEALSRLAENGNGVG